MTLHVEALDDRCVMRAAIYWSTWWEHAPGRAMVLPVLQRLAGFGWELDEASLGG